MADTLDEPSYTSLAVGLAGLDEPATTPDPDEVRRALGRMRDQEPGLYSFERVVCEAAEAWLREHGAVTR